MNEQLRDLMFALMVAKQRADAIQAEGLYFEYRTHLQKQITSLLGYVEGWQENVSSKSEVAQWPR